MNFILKQYKVYLDRVAKNKPALMAQKESVTDVASAEGGMEIEQLAIDKVCELYDCAFANVQPHSGVGANTAVYQALMEPGDTLMGMDLASGGHLSHGAPPTLSGKVYNAVTYGVDENGLLNYEEIRALAKVSSPKVIVAGASAYPRQINWEAFKDIADGVGAYLVVDMAHYSGLIAGKVYDSPLPYAEVVTSSTHKTLRGPRGGMILWNNPDYTKRINTVSYTHLTLPTSDLV